MIGNEAQDAFINRNKWAVVTTLRKDGSPANSVVFYARDGDTLIFSTTQGRLKARTIQRDSRVAFTVLDEGAPFGFVTIEGTATIESRDVVPGHILINKAMRGGEFTPPEGYAERLANDGRVVVRVIADRVSGVTNRR